MTMPSPPRRRWFQFNLRAMFFVVTALSFCLGWLGWELNYIRQRREMVSLIEQQGGSVYRWDRPRVYNPVVREPKQLPFWRRWLGDERITEIMLWGPTAQDEKQLVKDLFPEANRVWVFGTPLEPEANNPRALP